MNENNNRYAPPQAAVLDATPEVSESGFIEGGRARPIGDGLRWLGAAMRMFFAPPWWKWILVLLIWFVLSMCISLVPVLGIVNVFLGPIISGGIAYIADAQRRTGDFAIGDAFKGFNMIGQLLLVGLMLFLSSIILVVCILVSVGFDGLSALASGGIDQNDPYAILNMMWKGMLVAFVLWIPLISATLFAPALIVLHGMPAFTAMKNSFLGTFKNVLPGLLCAIVLTVLVVVSMLPLFLGLLITMPIATILGYTVYRGIFTEELA